METSQSLKLQSRRDEFSYQISASNDERFWFRLEREQTQDVITDFFMGALPETQAATALIECYLHLGLVPKNTLIFRNILPCSESEADTEAYSKALQEAQQLFSDFGQAALAYFGATKSNSRLDCRRGKFDLIIQVDVRNDSNFEERY